MAELFDIDHETGDLSQYDSTVTDGGDLSVTAAAALAGTNYGLQAFIDDGNSIYGQKNQADTGTRKIRCRFYLSQNTYNSFLTSYTKLFWLHANFGQTNIVSISFFRTAEGVYQVNFRVYRDAGLQGIIYIDVTGEHYIEFYVIQASNDVASDGSCQLWFDGVLKKTWNDIDNYDIFDLMDYLQFGAISPAFGTAGTLYLDQLKANDDGSEIGEHIPTAASRHNRPVIKIEGAERLYGLRRHAIW